MILRRVIEHFRNQEWTAIAIDFVIVVVGVFVGIQVANWNQQRLDLQKERDFLIRQQLELRQNLAATAEKTDFMGKVYQSAEQAITFINADKSCEKDCWQLVVTFFYATQWRDYSPTRNNYDEMKKLGLPRSLHVKDALDGYFNEFDSLISVQSQLPAFRELVRSIIPPAVQEYLWLSCYQYTGGGTELMLPDCAPSLSEGDSRTVLDMLRRNPQTLPTLTYWMSNIASAIPSLENQITDVNTILEVIDAELERLQ